MPAYNWISWNIPLQTGTSNGTLQCSFKIYQLFDGDGGGDLSPEASKLDRGHQFLRVSVYVSMEHEAAEGRSQVEGQRLVHHAEEDELHVQLLGDLVYGQILTVQTHAGKELQLVPEDHHRDRKVLFRHYW